MAKKKTQRRARFTGVRVLPALEALVQTSIWTEAIMGVNPVEFFTGVTDGVFKPGRDGAERITLPELIGAGPGGFGGNFGAGGGTLLSNIESNVGGMGGLITTGLKSAGTSIAFRLVSKATRRARSGLNSQILKPLGLNSMVRV